jgi:hypothetical protein
MEIITIGLSFLGKSSPVRNGWGYLNSEKCATSLLLLKWRMKIKFTHTVAINKLKEFYKTVTGEKFLIFKLPKSKSRYNWRSVNQYVKVPSPLWDLWPDITFWPKDVFWKLLSCLCGAPSLTRDRICHLSFSVYSNLSVFVSNIYVTCVLQFSNLYTCTIYIKLRSVPSQCSRLCSTSYYGLKLPQ